MASISPHTKGMLFGLASNLSYSCTIPIVKMIYLHNTSISSYEVMYWNSVIMMVMTYAFVRVNGKSPIEVQQEYRNVIVVRAILGYCGLQGWWSSVYYIPVSVANCIFFTYPIWAGIYCFCWLKEKLTIYDIFSVFAAFVGVIIVNNPWGESL